MCRNNGNMKPLVAIVGMCGSGKSLITSYFKQKGWQVIHFGDITMQELNARGLQNNEINERSVREELREIHGPNAYAKLLLPKITEAIKTSPTVLDGLYSWSEYKLLKQEFSNKMNVLAIVANRDLRYKRLAARMVRPLTPEEAKLRDYAEIENLEKGGPIAIADYTIVNNGTEEELNKQFEMFFSNLYI